jgi:F0F1-type ATP synthase membrane subunit a
MIPFSFTVTSHIVVTLGLAMISFFAINIIGIQTHGFHMLSLFLPSGIIPSRLQKNIKEKIANKIGKYKRPIFFYIFS